MYILFGEIYFPFNLLSCTTAAVLTTKFWQKMPRRKSLLALIPCGAMASYGIMTILNKYDYDVMGRRFFLLSAVLSSLMWFLDCRSKALKSPPQEIDSDPHILNAIVYAAFGITGQTPFTYIVGTTFLHLSMFITLLASICPPCKPILHLIESREVLRIAALWDVVTLFDLLLRPFYKPSVIAGVVFLFHGVFVTLYSYRTSFYHQNLWRRINEPIERRAARGEGPFPRAIFSLDVLFSSIWYASGFLYPTWPKHE